MLISEWDTQDGLLDSFGNTVAHYGTLMHVNSIETFEPTFIFNAPSMTNEVLLRIPFTDHFHPSKKGEHSMIRQLVQMARSGRNVLVHHLAAATDSRFHSVLTITSTTPSHGVSAHSRLALRVRLLERNLLPNFKHGKPASHLHPSRKATQHPHCQLIHLSAVVTMLYGEPSPVYELALQSHAEHAGKHGYSLMVLRQKLLGRLWSKPAYILSIILNELQKPESERLRWLFWFDADTVVINPQIPLDIFLPPSPDFDHIHFLCGYDHNGLNDGAFLLRINDYSLHLMAAALTVESFRPEVNLQYSEQSAIEHLVTSKDMVRPWENFTYADGYAKIPQRWLNAYMGPRTPEGVVKPKKQFQDNSVREGDMLVHFAGSGDTKQKRMLKFLKALRKEREAWTLELKDTEYEAEIADFWKGMRTVQ